MSVEELKNDIHEMEKEVDVLLRFASGLQNFHEEGAVKIGRQPKLDNFGVMMTDANDNIIYEDVEIDNIGEMEKMVAEAELSGFVRSDSRGYPIMLSFGPYVDAAKIVLNGRVGELHTQKFSVNTDKIWEIAKEKAYELAEMRKSAGIR